jgi:hypothetical protein
MLRQLMKSALVAAAVLAVAGCAARHEGAREYHFCAVDDGSVPPPPTMRMVPHGQAAAYTPAIAPPPPPAVKPVRKPKPQARPAPIKRPAPAASARPAIPPPPPESALAASRPATPAPVEAGAAMMPVPRASATAPSIMPVPSQQPPAMAPVVGPNADPTRPAIASPPPAPGTPPAMAQLAPRMPGYIEAENLRALLERAWSMVSIGNVRGARALLTEAASRGIVEALVALGETYDPAALARRQLRSNSVDPDKALEIYEQAIAKGSDTARTNRDLLKAYLAEKKN